MTFLVMSQIAFLKLSVGKDSIAGSLVKEESRILTIQRLCYFEINVIKILLKFEIGGPDSNAHLAYFT
jgi:hypothetical protein